MDNGVSVIEDREFATGLKKAKLRWSIYRFPVNYVLTGEEESHLKKMPIRDSLPPPIQDEHRLISQMGRILTLAAVDSIL